MRFSVEVYRYGEALAWCLKKLTNNIPDLDDWRFSVNAGGIDYGIYLNIDTDEKEIEICNQPRGEGSDYLDDVIACLEEKYEDEDEE